MPQTSCSFSSPHLIERLARTRRGSSGDFLYFYWITTLKFVANGVFKSARHLRDLVSLGEAWCCKL